MNYKDDFYEFINSVWLSKNDIPHDESRWGVFQELQEDIDNKLKNILESDDIDHRLKIIYNQYHNKYNPIHLNIINKIINIINKSNNYEILFDIMFKFGLLLNISLPITVHISPNMKNSDILIPHITSNGLGLPDKDFYFSSNKKDIRKKYMEFIKNYLSLFNINCNYKYIYYIELILANKTYNNVDKSNPYLLHNIYDYNDFINKYPNLKFINNIFINIKPDIINVTNIKYMELVNNLIPNVNLTFWKDYFIYKVLIHFNEYINKPIEDCYFNFYNSTLLGVIKQKSLWTKSIYKVDKFLGELLGKEYIKKYFDDNIKITIHKMIKLIKQELLYSITHNDWMTQNTKLKAIQKLNKINIKIGYPDKYTTNYDNLILNESDSYLENIIKIYYFDYVNDINQIYTHKNKYKWFMNPYDINAYYSPSYNEIVFPAGILQSPFFSLEQDMAENFGGIGMIIGHEIIHGFDDNGKKYDENGNLNNWWTSSDLEKYSKKLELVKNQYNSYEIEGIKLNGELTLGENVSDIGGLNISIKSMIKYFKDFPNINEKIKLFFINYANIWRIKIRKEDSIQRLSTDPHSPPNIRVNCVIKNNPYFHKVFKTQPSDKLYLEPDKIINIW